tara:strand:- start:617 stop:718 length:102 start_codon:yes stop_codon:yes gene_type:complete
LVARIHLADLPAKLDLVGQMEYLTQANLVNPNN